MAAGRRRLHDDVRRPRLEAPRGVSPARSSDGKGSDRVTSTMKSWGQTSAIVLVGSVFVAVGLSDFSGPVVGWILGGVLPVVGGTCAVVAGLMTGIRLTRGRVRYRGFAPRGVDLDPS